MAFRTGLLTLLFCSMTLHAENWPGWRGPGNQGISGEPKLPVQFDKQRNVAWKVPLKENGVSQPVVWGDHVFITSSDGVLNDRLHVTCYHRAGGKKLWHTRLFGTAPTDLFAPGGMAVPTPVTDGKLLYVLFGTGDLAALDFAGKPVWIRSLAEEYGPFRNRWGMGTSPILVDDMLIVLVDHWSQSYLLAVDPRSGVNRWKTDRVEAVNWTTPLPLKVAGRTQIVAFGTNHARGYDAATGKELWHAAGMNYQCIPSPVSQGNVVFACSGDNVFALKLDANTAGDVTATHVLWKNTKDRAFLPSPLVHGGQLYVPGDKGFVVCLDVKTGKRLWRERMDGQYFASPVAGAGVVYFATREGVVRVVRTGPEFELLAENDLGEGIVASPALSNGQIFIRGDKHLFCIGEK